MHCAIRAGAENTAMKQTLIAAALLLVAALPARSTEQPAMPAIPSFADETATSGLDSTYAGEWEFMVGGGAAAFDCNEDRLPDLFIAGGTSPAKFYRNTSKQGGALTFAVETNGLELEKVTGAYPVDIDSDGNKDLVLLRVGENIAMRGLGNCRFERANEAWRFDGGDAWSAAFAATWEKGANWPTLAIGNYIDRTQEIEPWGSCTDNWLHRPEGAGFDEPLPLRPSFCALSLLFTDWNRSGTPSLRVSNDREYYEGGQEQMWKLPPSQAPALYTEAEGWRYVRIWGMGIASFDLDFDGYPEYFLTSMADNRLQLLADAKANALKPSYAEQAFKRGITAHRPYTGGDERPSTAWHTDFQDANNDGLVDLLIVKGNVAKMPDFAAKDPNNLLLQRSDGTFVEAGDKAGIASLKTGRGGAFTDFNLDGLVDILVVNRWDKAEIWRNTSAEKGNFIAVDVEQPAPNRDAINGWIEVKRGETIMRREITIGGGHASGHLGWQHFGLGAQAEADIRVLWPDGTASDWSKVAANAFYTVERGTVPKLWTPN
jgi:enediyne biosynthesis protein E4